MALKINGTLQARDYLDKIAHKFVDGVNKIKDLLDSKDSNKFDQIKSTADDMVQTFENNNLGVLTTVACNKAQSTKASLV